MNQPLKENPQKRIAFLTYSRLYNLLTLTSEKEDFENIRIISSNFNDTLQIVRGLIDKNMIDIAIAGGSNARLIKEKPSQSSYRYLKSFWIRFIICM